MKSKSRKLDDLTGLYTRSFLKPYVNDLIEDRKSFRLFLLDIDFFKMINDSYGHMRGDEVLRDVADILEKSVQNRGTVVRYGGDEFIIIVTDKSLMDSFEGYINDIVFHREFAGDPPVRISFTIGSATYPEDGDDLSKLLKCADDILLKAKRKDHYGIRFIGRENVLSILKSGLEEASRGNPKFIYLTGVEGVGKTRILSELLIYANLAGFDATSFNCKKDFGYEPLQFLTGDKSFNPTWKVLNSISPSISGRPVFWCIDDIESCSMETRKFLEKLPSIMGKEKFFLILSGKEDVGMNQFLKINLEPLDLYGTKDFISSFIGMQDIDDNLVAYLFDKTRGIPGKLLSTLNNFLNNNVIKLGKNKIQMGKIIDTDIEGNLFKTYKKLKKEEGMIFQVGALLGDIGDCELIADILGISRDEVYKMKNFGLSVGLLKPSENFIISTEELRKKLYQGIGSKRKELHRKAGMILSRKGYPGPSAYQFGMAGDFVNETEQSLLLVRTLLDKGLLIDAEEVLGRLKKWINEEWFNRKTFYERWGDIFYKKGEFRNALEMFNKALENKKDVE
ncbi:diguanylate cyclase, partial [candidate division WOR-3 bacterium]|nr:diguanylate cyclase [candidate division WOR-3 bacterium]